MQSQKEIYRRWSENEPAIPVFSRDWWLDAVCGEANWDVILVCEKGEVVASMPYFLENRGGFCRIRMPQFTQTMGPYLKQDKILSHSDKLSREKKIFGEMIERLPRFDRFNVRFNYVHTNWLPFYWAGFKQTTVYTYIIPDLSDHEKVYSDIAYAKKGDIKKARNNLEIGFDLSAPDFYQHHMMTLGKRGAKISYSYELFERLYTATYQRSSGRVIYANDKDTNIHAALFVVWGREGAYHLINTIDPDHRSSGALSLLVYEIVKYVSAFTNRYDFEGSMIESVEASYQKFGSIQTPYMVITKTPSRLLRARAAVRDLLAAAPS